MSETLAVIGGSGFIGTRFVRRVRLLGVKAWPIDLEKPGLREPTLRVADVRDPESLVRGMRGASIIVNLAAEHRDDVRPIGLYKEVNVDGARNICMVADRLQIRRQLFTSSVAVYGLAAAEADEEAPLRPFNEYGRTKALAENIYREWVNQGDGRAVTILRPTVVFGAGNRGNVHNLIRQIGSGQFVMIGSGDNRKSMAYVDNVVEALCFLLRRERDFEIFNYVDKPDYTMNELVALVRAELGKNGFHFRLPKTLGLSTGRLLDHAGKVLKRTFPISEVRIRKFMAETVFSAERISVAGFRPPYSLLDGLRETIRSDFVAP